MRGQSRPARKPLEGCLCLLTAVLLNKPDRLLLQDNLRLSGATYTVGAGRRAGGDTRPYEILYPFLGGRPPWGNSTKGARRPPFGRFKGKGFQRRGGRFPLSGGNVERSETKRVGTIRNPPLL